MAKRRRVTAHALAKHLQDSLNMRDLELVAAKIEIQFLKNRVKELERDLPKIPKKEGERHDV